MREKCACMPQAGFAVARTVVHRGADVALGAEVLRAVVVEVVCEQASRDCQYQHGPGFDWAIGVVCV